MKKTSVLLLICFLSLVTKVSHANEMQEEWDYLEITQGTPAPINGLLFSYDGMSNAIVKIQQKMKLVEIEKDQEKEKLKIALEAQIKTVDIKLNALQEQHTSQIKIKNHAIESLTKDLELSKIKGYGGLMLGLASGLIIMGLIYGNK